MVDHREPCFYNPGEYVCLQGEKSPDFFRVISGRFAKVKSKAPANSVGIQKMLTNAELLEVVSKQQLLCEIEALMGESLPFSVFALDPSEVRTIPASDPIEMQQTFSSTPKVGVYTCVSFARYLSQFFQYFNQVAREETSIDQFAKTAARDYLAVINELEVLAGGNLCMILADAKKHPAYQISKEIQNSSATAQSGSSVACGIVPNSGEAKIQKFKSGTLLCKSGAIGDSLFVICNGAAEVVTEGNNPNIIIDTPGSVIGEIAVFLNYAADRPNTKRTADVVCATDVEAIVVNLNQIEDFFVRQPDLMTRILMQMVSRSENTKTFCLATERRLKSLLYSKLGVVLEGLNQIAHAINSRQDKGSVYTRPLSFCAQRSRAVFERFRESLSVLAGKNQIRT